MSNRPSLFEGRKLIIATMHGKEKVIAATLKEALGVIPEVPALPMDTDRFGTFSGEIDRIQSPLEAARSKNLAAFHLTGETLVLASEGSFGPHPVIGFVPADEELLVLNDFANKIEIMAKRVSTETNFNGQLFTTAHDAMRFAEQVLFPSHALILRPQKNHRTDIVKGIQEPAVLEQQLQRYLMEYGKVFVETDMRAMYNPSRMKVIAETTELLIQKIRSVCPACAMPGYDVKEVHPGLPCELCGTPTRTTLSHWYACEHCGHREERKYPHQKTTENPQYCDVCNP